MTRTFALIDAPGASSPVGVLAATGGAAPARRDPPAWIEALGRQGASIVAAVAVGLAAGWAVYRLQPPTYVSVARVLVRPADTTAPLAGPGSPPEAPRPADGAARNLETEIALLRSRSAAERIVAQYDIRLRELPATSWIDSIRRIRRAVERQFNGAPPADAGLPREGGASADGEPSDARARESSSRAPADAFLEGVTVGAVRSRDGETASDVMEVRLASSDRALAPRALGALVEAYLATAARESAQLAGSIDALLRARVDEAQRELQQVDADLTALAARHGLRAGFGGAAAGARPGDDPLLASMAAQVVRLQAQLDVQRRGTGEESTSLLRQTRRRLDGARGRLANQLQAYAAANAEAARLERRRALLQERQVDARRRLDGVELFLSLKPAVATGRSLIDPPSLPAERDGQRSAAALAFGPVAGLALGLGLAGLRESSHRRLRTRRDVERELGLPLLGALPVMRMQP